MTPFDCPRCGATLTMTERHGVEIDYCPQCRGVWLDRGELDKIIERAGPAMAPPAPPPSGGAPAGGWTQPVYAQTPPQPAYSPRHDDDGGHRSGGHRGYGGRSRKNWLSELFD